MEQKSRLGNINPKYNTIKLKEILTRDNSGEWGDEPDKEFIYVIRGTNFNNDGILNITDIALRYLTAEQIKEKKLYENDIIIERSGGSDTQPVGRVGFIDKKIADINCTCANFIQRISLIDSVNSKYIYYCLQQLYEMKQTTAMQAQTTGLRNLDWKMYKKTILPNPELKEQNAIAGIISKVDQCIENVQKTIDATEKLKKSLMQNLLTGRMKPDGTMRKDDEFYLHPKMGKVPLGWEVKKIKEVYNRKTDTIDPTKSKDVYPYLGLEHIVPNEFRRIGNGFSNETAALKVIFNKGDLLYGKLRPYLNKVFISDIDGVGSTEFLVFEQNEYTNWLYFILQTTDFLNFTKSMTAGTQHPRVSWNDIKKRFIAIPEKDERDAITYILNSLSDDNKRNKIEYLYRLKKSLMQNLLTGKKRVDVDKINSLLDSMK